MESADQPARDYWGRLPFFGIVILPALGLCLIGEQFPYSDFPMYSSFSNRTTVHYLTDADNQPVACQRLTGLNSARLKKTFGTELDKSLAQQSPLEKTEDLDGDALDASRLRLRQETAKRLLTRLVRERAVKKRKLSPPPVLRYVVKELSIEQGKYFEKDTVLAEITTGESVATKP